jgi:coenzyme F420-reducing hydrogenase delta subunit
MSNKRNCTLALFYCQNSVQGDERERRSLEERYSGSLRLFPMPCSGRVEPVHLLRALEEFADAAYVITCPGGACRHFEGNFRAKKRVERAREIIESIGLERERVGIVVSPQGTPASLIGQTEKLMEALARLDPSPVLNAPRRTRAGS